MSDSPPSSARPKRDRLLESEARERARIISQPRYELKLEIDGQAETYRGEATIRFRAQKQDTFLDFTGFQVDLFEINGQPLELPPEGEFRLPLPAERLQEENTVVVRYENRYDHHGAGFHRFQDPEDGEVYLYSDFEPFCAHRLFPCFDQPDLKASYALTVRAPANWKVIANAACHKTIIRDGAWLEHCTKPLPPFSTYLLALIAGPYEEVRDTASKPDLGLFCRKALRPHLDPEEIFTITRQGFAFYEQEFAREYAFGKYDQIFAPEFNSGAMENVGAVTFNESNIFRDPPTETQRLRRAEVILHEMAHMWFGDLVTMRWWDGLWLNESFATFISYLALFEATRFDACWENFLGSIKAWALRQDELPTTHPISGPVGDTEQTFLNFDGITYGKGASVLKQMRAFVGPEAFRAGIRKYFQEHALGNTSIGDFLAPLSEASGRDLESWARLWLETSGVNAIQPKLTAEEGHLVELSLSQEPGNGDALLRPHKLEVGFFTRQKDGSLELCQSLPALVKGRETPLVEARGQALPDLVWANLGDHAYAKIFLDPASLLCVRKELHRVGDPLVRAGLYLTLWDMTRAGQLAPRDYLDLAARTILHEEREQVVESVLRNAQVALFRYLDPKAIPETSRRMFQTLQTAQEERQVSSDLRLLWARHLIGFAAASGPLETIARYLEGDGPGGIPVDQGMRWRILTRLCAHGVDGAQERLDRERKRDPSARGVKAHFAATTALPEASIKRRAFDQFKSPSKVSTDVLKHGMLAFWWPHQSDLLAPFAQEFLEALPQVLRQQDLEYATRGFARYLFPHAVGNPALLLKAEAARDATPDEQAILKRILLEECEELKRVVTLRAL